MQCFRKVTEDLYWVGGNDRQIELFENIFPLAKGVSYNSYLLLDEQTVLFDTADYAIGKQFIENVMSVLNGRNLDYIVVNHMEPDPLFSYRRLISSLSRRKDYRKRKNIPDDRTIFQL